MSFESWQKDNSTIVNNTIDTGGGDTPPVIVKPTGTTQLIDWALGNNYVVDLTGGTLRIVHLTFANPVAGGRYAIKFIGNIGNTVAWPSNVKWPTGIGPTISALLGAIDLVYLLFDGTNYLATFNQGFA